VTLHDGDGWVSCRCGRRHWGLFGAAGLLLLDARPGSAPVPPRALLQLRAAWVHQGGTWALPGGARDSHEDVVATALREAWEEVGARARDVAVLEQVRGVDHGDWSYDYVVARAVRPLTLRVATPESDELRWVGLDAVPDLALHPALAAAWPDLVRTARRVWRDHRTGPAPQTPWAARKPA
jgi:8-oxo-dGTP diphosphatase